MNQTQTHYRACNLCEAMCGLEIKVEGDTVLSIRGDKADPFSRGAFAPRLPPCSCSATNCSCPSPT